MPPLPLVAHIRPQGIQLRTHQMVMGQQQGFDLFPMPGRFPPLVQDGLFLDPFNPDPTELDDVAMPYLAVIETPWVPVEGTGCSAGMQRRSAVS